MSLKTCLAGLGEELIFSPHGLELSTGVAQAPVPSPESKEKNNTQVKIRHIWPATSIKSK